MSLRLGSGSGIGYRDKRKAFERNTAYPRGVASNSLLGAFIRARSGSRGQRLRHPALPGLLEASPDRAAFIPKRLCCFKCGEYRRITDLSIKVEERIAPFDRSGSGFRNGLLSFHCLIHLAFYAIYVFSVRSLETQTACHRQRYRVFVAVTLDECASGRYAIIAFVWPRSWSRAFSSREHRTILVRLAWFFGNVRRSRSEG